jgi:hypothetical protein
VAPRRKAVAHRPDGGGEAGEQAREPASRTVEVAARADGDAAAPALLRRPLPVARHDGKVTNFAASTAAQGGQRRPSDAAARRPLLRRVLDPERRSAGPAEGARAIESPRGGVVARGGRVDELLQRLERADAQTELPDTPEGLVRLLKVKQGGEVGRSRRSRPKRPGIRAAVSFAPAPPEACGRQLEEDAALSGLLGAAGDLAAPGRKPGSADAVEVSEEALAAARAAHAARSAVQLSAQPVGGFPSAAARDRCWLDGAVEDALRWLPEASLRELAGGSRSAAQVPPAERAFHVRAALREVSDVRGFVLRDMAKLMAYFAAYAEARGWQSMPSQVSAGLAASMIAGEHARATLDGRGSRGGATVGDGFRKLLVVAANRFAVPIEYDHPMVWGAAPAAKQSGGRQKTAATAPPQVSLHTMVAARAPEPSVLRFMARSMVFCEIVEARVQDAERIVLEWDGDDSARIMRGFSYLAKDGSPIALRARAMDYIGEIEWWPQHVREARELGGNAFPRWEGPWGSRSNLAKAERLLPEAAARSEIRAAMYSVWAQSPLELTPQRRAEVGCAGHSLHGSPPDLAAFIAEHPRVPYALDADLARGFTYEDVRELGHWLRDKRSGSETATRSGSAPAQPPGAPAEIDTAAHLYSRGENRLGEQSRQLRVRARLCRFVQTAVRQMGVAEVMRLPLTPASWGVLLGVDDGSGAVEVPRAQPASRPAADAPSVPASRTARPRVPAPRPEVEVLGWADSLSLAVGVWSSSLGRVLGKRGAGERED